MNVWMTGSRSKLHSQTWQYLRISWAAWQKCRSLALPEDPKWVCAWRGPAVASHAPVGNFLFLSPHSKFAFEKKSKQRVGLIYEDFSCSSSYDSMNYICRQFPNVQSFPARLDFSLETKLSSYICVLIFQVPFPVEVLLIKPNSQFKLKCSVRDWNKN